MALNLTLQCLSVTLIIHLLWAVVQCSAQCPTYCTCEHQSIVCSGTGLTKVPIFNVPSNYLMVILENSNIVDIPANAFSKLSSLTLITIKSHKLETINENAFSGLKKLNHLIITRLTGQSTRTISITNIISTLSGSLNILEVKGLKMPQLTDSFIPTSRVKKLTLDLCGIGSISRNAFVNSMTIEELKIVSNPLSQLNLMTWLKPMTNLRSLDLSNNSMVGNLPEFPNLPTLTKLTLNRNRFVKIPQTALTKVRNSLEILNLQHNIKLTSINLGILNLNNLITLDLSYSGGDSLISIPPAIVGLTNLQTLNLERTALTHISPGQLPRSLKVLKLAACGKLNKIDDQALEKTPNLEEIDLLDIDFSTMHVSWKNVLKHDYIPRLQKLTLVSKMNKPKVINDNIWDVLQPFTDLKLLNLDENGLTKIPNFFFQNFKNLETLYLQTNKISFLNSASLYGLTEKTDIRLSGNQLTVFDSCTLSRFINLDKIKLLDNKLSCNCSMRWLRVRLNQTPDSQKQLDYLTCSSGKSWKQTTPDTFCTADEAKKLPPCTNMEPSTVAPRTTTLGPPKYKIGVSVSDVSPDTGDPQVRILINATEHEKRYPNWFVVYGQDCSRTPYKTIERGIQNSITISTHLLRSSTYCFCPVLSLMSDIYKHPDYCRKLTVSAAGGLQTAALIGAVLGAVVLLFAIVAIAIFCFLKRRRTLDSKGADKPNVDEDPYAYAEPDMTLGKRSSGGPSREQLNMRPRARPNSRAFTRAKSQDAHLNMSQNSLASSRVPMHRSTPVLQKAGAQNGHANRGFANSVSSLHAVSAGSAGMGQVSPPYPQWAPQQYPQGAPQQYPHQQYHQRQQPPPVQSRAASHQPSHQPSHFLSRSTDHLAFRSSSRALPPPPRNANSAEVVLDPQRAANQYEYIADSSQYLSMTDSRIGSLESSSDPQKPNPHPPMRPPRSRLASAASNELPPDDSQSSYVPMAIVPGSPGSPGDRNSQAHLLTNEYGVENPYKTRMDAQQQDEQRGPYYEMGKY